MTKLFKSSQAYWQHVSEFGGVTAIPRWTSDPTPTPVPTIAEHNGIVSDELAADLHDLALKNALSLRSIFLAAHAKVLAALSGEAQVTTGYVSNNSPQPLPCRLAVDPGSWRSLLLEINRREEGLLSHCELPVEELMGIVNKREQPFESVFDPTGNVEGLPANVVFSFAMVEQGDKPAFRLRYQTQALDHESGQRIADYHLAALAQMVADPEADHHKQSLLSADELRFQIEGLAGPHKELPDLRFHELFEQRVVDEPEAIAAIFKDQSWTYRELNSRANRIGRTLQGLGLQPQDIVAVVSERNLDWMASVIGVFKAGGVYLPIEPHFPADRIARMLSRADCRFVVTEPESDTTLDQALETLPSSEKFFATNAYEENANDQNLGVKVSLDDPAYIYFTSGSTGEPKGAMCEHAGFLNHLMAKVEDFGIERGQVVAQIAPQCFDISLWQLVGALMVGGGTLIVEQDVVLDVEKFVDKIVGDQVSVMQVVPSYLEVLLSYLEENERPLQNLHCVSVTGEALSIELAQRWFAAKPHIKLANAYGLTETCDDTNHEVMHKAPSGDQVSLGPCVTNVYAYIVDENLSPVPLGAPGEIVFSGVCVGRGYVNDPERTQMAFMDDPLRAGERLYRSGDFGRWHPDRKLEFLGRQDAQIKIRGFRIEIGDIENGLMRVPGIKLSAVVVVERGAGNKQLVAYYSGEKEVEAAVVQRSLAQALPEYMVPSIFHWQETLPLTANGKIDKKVLRKLAAEVEDDTGELEPPETPSEQMLAKAWAKVLGIPYETIGRSDHFFDRGGTSLSAVKLVIALGKKVSLKDITQHRVLSELAGLMDGKVSGPTGLLQNLSEDKSSKQVTLVCFPYAGGNAVNFQPIAKALKNSGISVYAVEYPGHDLTSEPKSFASIKEVGEQVVGEIAALGLASVMLWGHSSGVAFAIEAARGLALKGIEVQRVYLGAQLLGDAEHRLDAIETLKQQSNSEIAERINGDKGLEPLHGLSDEQLDRAGASYRHDFNAANQYLAEVQGNPPKHKLQVAVTVVGAADDPSTAELSRQYSGWQAFADQLDLHVLEEGGHYFLRTRPQEVAQIILSGAALAVSPHIENQQKEDPNVKLPHTI